VARIALEVGYESEAAFNRAFKREYGQPPARYRRQRQAGK
jgi:AraC-like DNA-binding protein